jgi:hypothetical protein
MTASEVDDLFEERGNVVVSDLTDWSGDPDEIDRDESPWLEIASQEHVTGAVTELSDDLSLASETQERIMALWGDDADAAGLDRIAFVSEKVKGMAVSANVDSDAEMKAFTAFDEAFEWAGATGE